MRRPVDVELNNSLAMMGLWRKPTAEDTSSLFRVVAEQVYNSQALYRRVRMHCLSHLRYHRAKYEAVFGLSYEEHLSDLEEGRIAGGHVEIEALSLIYRRDIIVYQGGGLRTVQMTNHGFAKKMMFCFTNGPHGHHYDAIYSSKFPEHAAICQSLLYEVLYDKVFGVSNIVSAAAESMKRFGLPTDDVEAVKISPCSTGSSDYYSRSADNSMDNTAASEVSEGGVYVPYKLAKSLCVMVFRNIEFELWLEEKRDMKQQGMLASLPKPKELSPGDQCLLQAHDGRLLHAYVQHIAYDHSLATVFVEEMGERINVPVASLKLFRKEIQMKIDFSSEPQQVMMSPGVSSQFGNSERGRPWGGHFTFRRGQSMSRVSRGLYGPRLVRGRVPSASGFWRGGGRQRAVSRGRGGVMRMSMMEAGDFGRGCLGNRLQLHHPSHSPFGLLRGNMYHFRGGQQQQHSSSSDFRRPFSDAGNSDDVDTVCRDLSDLDVVPADESNVGSLKDDTGSQFDDTSSVAGQEDDGGVAEQGHVADGTAALTDYLPDANTSTDIVNGYSTPTREGSEINVTTPPTPHGGATVVDSPNLPVGAGTAMVPIHLCPMPGFERPTPFNMHTSISKEADGSDLPLSGVFIDVNTLRYFFNLGIQCFHNHTQLVQMHQPYVMMTYDAAPPSPSLQHHPSSAPPLPPPPAAVVGRYMDHISSDMAHTYGHHMHAFPPTQFIGDMFTSAGPSGVVMVQPPHPPPAMMLPSSCPPSSPYVHPPLPPIIMPLGVPHPHHHVSALPYADTPPSWQSPVMYGTRLQHRRQDCAICLGRVRHAVRLPCSHSFCRSCLDRLRQEEAACAYLCPLCRQPMSLSSPPPRAHMESPPYYLTDESDDGFSNSPQSPQFFSPVSIASLQSPHLVSRDRTPTRRRLADRVTVMEPRQLQSSPRPAINSFSDDAPAYRTRSRQPVSGVTIWPAMGRRGVSPRAGQGQIQVQEAMSSLGDRMAELGRLMTDARGDGNRMMAVGREMMAVGRRMSQEMGRQMRRQVTSLFDNSDWLSDFPAYGGVGSNSYFSLQF